MLITYHKYKMDYLFSYILITALLASTYIPVLFGYMRTDITNAVLSIFSIYVLSSLLLFKNIKITIIDLFIIMISLISVLVSQNFSLIAPAIFCILIVYFDNVDCRKLLKYYLILYMILVTIIVINYFLFNNGNNDITMWRIDQLITRKSLGFGHPNSFSIAWLGICMTYLLNLKRSYLMNGIFLLVMNIIFYRLTRSRTEFIIITLSVIMTIIFNKKSEHFIPKWMKHILAMTPLLFLGISFLIMWESKNPIINSYLSGRPTLYKQFFDMGRITLLGNSIFENAMFDNGFLQMLLSKGVITFLVYILVVMRWINGHKITYKSFFVLGSLFLCGITETVLFKFELFTPIIIYISQSTKSMK